VAGLALLCRSRGRGVTVHKGLLMGKYRVIEEWTNFRIVEIDAESEEEAIDLVADGEGDEVDGGTDSHNSEAVLQA